MLKSSFIACVMLLLLVTPEISSAFAANKKGGGGGKKKGAARTNKGFGAPLPTLEDALAKFRTRVPVNAEAQPCPCGTGKLYGDCCGPFHCNERLCLTMTDVLRSRYSAFSWRKIKYVMDTTHETCRDYREDRIAWATDLNKGGMFDSFDFVNLDAGAEEPSTDNENEGFLEFEVTLRAREDATSDLAGQETVIAERSRFLRDGIDGSWSYASGDVRSNVAGLEGTTLNN
jgi:SEC-C motif-containing protein